MKRAELHGYCFKTANSTFCANESNPEPLWERSMRKERRKIWPISWCWKHAELFAPREINENWRATWSVAFNAYQRDDIAIPRKEHGKTYVLSGDRVTSVLTNWGQLFVRRWRCIGKPYRSIQSICTAVHDELELHSTTLNLEALVSEGFTFQATLLPLLRKNQLFWS